MNAKSTKFTRSTMNGAEKLVARATDMAISLQKANEHFGGKYEGFGVHVFSDGERMVVCNFDNTSTVVYHATREDVKIARTYEKAQRRYFHQGEKLFGVQTV